MPGSRALVLEAAGREVTITNPDKVYFPETGITKGEVARYYLAVGDAALRWVRERPIVLKRYVNGIGAPAFYQKRAPESRPDWVETVTLRFPSGRTADEVVLRDLAQLLWIVNLGCIELHPHPVRFADLDHPDELRIDLDPVPGVPWSEICAVALVCRDVLTEHGLRGWPKTSGSRGMHVNARIEPRWGFDEVRRAALTVAREVERRMPGRATSAWWKEERQGVFLDYNQNAKDRTTAGSYSVRPTADARVSTPLTWDEVEGSDPALFTLRTVPQRVQERGDVQVGMDEAAGGLDSLLARAAELAAAGVADAPWPPHYAKQEGEAPRVAPSRGRGRRVPSAPLIVVARAQDQAAALAGLERWKARHPQAAAHLTEADVLVDSMRGRFTTWTRVRINLRHVPAADVPPEEPPDPDDDPTANAPPRPRRRKAPPA